MKLNLSSTYSLRITISLELIDVSANTPNGVKDLGDNCDPSSDILSTYFEYVKDINAH